MLTGRFYKKTVVKWIISLALFISATVIAVSISLYSWYSANNIELYSHMAQNILQNTSGTLEQFDKSLESVGFLAVHDNDMATMMYGNTRDPWLQGILQNKIINLIFSNPAIDSAYVVNKKAGWVVGSPNADKLNINTFSSFVSSNVKEQNQNAIIRINTYKIGEMGNFPEKDIVSYVFFQTRQSTGEDSFLVLNVKQTEISKLLLVGNTMTNSRVFVTDGRGRVVFTQDQAQLFAECGYTGYFQHILEGHELSGYFVYNDAGFYYLVTFVRSAALDYCFISITPYETVRETSIALRNRTIFLSIIILVTGILIAAAMSMYFYTPLRRLLKKYFPEIQTAGRDTAARYENEYELIDRFIEKKNSSADTLVKFQNNNLPIVKQEFLRNIVEGRIALNNDESKRRIAEVGIDLSHEMNQIIYLNIDKAVALGGRPDALQGLKASICIAAQDRFSLLCGCEIIRDMKDDSVVVLLNYEQSSPDMTRGIENACSSIQEFVCGNTGATLTIAIGRASNNDVYSSYFNATELLGYKVKYGDGALITNEKVSADISGHDRFPEKEEKNLLRSLKSLSKENCSEYIRKIISQFYSYSLGDILRAVNHILYSTFQVAQELIKNRDPSGQFDYFIAYEQLAKYGTLAELQENLILLYSSIIDDAGDGGNHIIKYVMGFIQNNYSNPMLSLEYVADQVKLNPSYLGKIFKEYSGLFFTEYVNNLRVEKAKHLLLNSSDNIRWISGLVGFNSAAYFDTCFKKQTGLTPAKFRESGIKNELR